jgi:hypothetical protein
MTLMQRRAPAPITELCKARVNAESEEEARQQSRRSYTEAHTFSP